MPKFKKNRVETYSPKGKRDFKLSDKVADFLPMSLILGEFLDDWERVRAKRVPSTSQVDFQKIDTTACT